MSEVSARRQEHKLRLMNDLLCEGQEIIIGRSSYDMRGLLVTCVNFAGMTKMAETLKLHCKRK